MPHAGRPSRHSSCCTRDARAQHSEMAHYFLRSRPDTLPEAGTRVSGLQSTSPLQRCLPCPARCARDRFRPRFRPCYHAEQASDCNCRRDENSPPWLTPPGVGGPILRLAAAAAPSASRFARPNSLFSELLFPLLGVLDVRVSSVGQPRLKASFLFIFL